MWWQRAGCGATAMLQTKSSKATEPFAAAAAAAAADAAALAAGGCIPAPTSTGTAGTAGTAGTGDTSTPKHHNQRTHEHSEVSEGSVCISSAVTSRAKSCPDHVTLTERHSARDVACLQGKVASIAGIAGEVAFGISRVPA